MRKNSKPKSLKLKLYKIGLVISLLVFTLSLVLGYILFIQFSSRINQNQLKSVLRGVEYSIRDDLLNGNYFVVNDKISNFIKRENLNNLCVSLKDLNAQYSIEIGRSNICKKSEINDSVYIFYDEKKEHPAYELNIHLSEIQIDAKTKFIILVFSIIISLISMIGVVLIIKIIHHNINLINSFISNDNLETAEDKYQYTEVKKILNLKNELVESLSLIQKQKVEKAMAETKVAFAAQVAHDIKSPLSVLNLIGKTISNELKNEHVDLFKLAIKRIQIISDDLLDKKDDYINYQISNSSLKECMLKIIQEKEYLISQSREDIKIVFKSSHLLNFNKLPIQVIERIFSNILNNSIEALSNSKNGIIEVSLTENNEKTSILIKDNGPGMSPEILQKVCLKGFTVGKNNGNGLGLYHAKSTIEASGGLFTITSVVDIGTTVNIVF